MPSYSPAGSSLFGSIGTLTNNQGMGPTAGLNDVADALEEQRKRKLMQMQQQASYGSALSPAGRALFQG
jgi:hypothetical protein